MRVQKPPALTDKVPGESVFIDEVHIFANPGQRTLKVIVAFHTIDGRIFEYRQKEFDVRTTYVDILEDIANVFIDWKVFKGKIAIEAR